ncbi:hypothetical protein [Arcanobacterium buesumense]|uniref:Thiamine pyrophosphate enzyme N-terminal TPP-binding domain-containing protein n=1 Tax=Arcanobacterium buesumense TaxID=2722751 RepID=A0A6H2ELK0_9ACTO|nr:hypothetical protein [Arcanobacterium buesumense]QJC21942.1 hypothetical protein HC352_05110 [Arcanobacterium buesumense]
MFISIPSPHTMLSSCYDYFPLVPCSEFNDIVSLVNLENVLFCSREEESIAVGAGLYIAGYRPLVMMQSSGLMSSLNTLGSLVIAYGIPLTIAVALRGGQDEYNPTQIPAGRAVKSTLETMGCKIVSVSSSEALNVLCDISSVPLSSRFGLRATVVLIER